eukprot:SAG11_NODE_2090_length_3843_cov_4.605502_5_plen_245_part_01
MRFLGGAHLATTKKAVAYFPLLPTACNLHSYWLLGDVPFLGCSRGGGRSRRQTHTTPTPCRSGRSIYCLWHKTKHHTDAAERPPRCWKGGFREGRERRHSLHPPLDLAASPRALLQQRLKWLARLWLDAVLGLQPRRHRLLPLRSHRLLRPPPHSPLVAQHGAKRREAAQGEAAQRGAGAQGLGAAGGAGTSASCSRHCASPSARTPPPSFMASAAAPCAAAAALRPAQLSNLLSLPTRSAAPPP